VTTYALVLALEILMAIFLLVIGGVRSRIKSASIYVAVAVVVFAICSSIRVLVASIADLVTWIEVLSIGLILIVGFAAIHRPKQAGRDAA
jgi:hypothetical protein